MHTSRFDLLVLNHHSDLSGPVHLRAPDAAVYVERPTVPTPQELDDAMSATFPSSLLTAEVTTTFGRLMALAEAPGEAQDVLRLIGPDHEVCHEDQIDAYRAAVDAGLSPPDDVPTAQVLVRRGALRAFIAERRTRQLISLVEQWSDESVAGLVLLKELLTQIHPHTGRQA